MVITVTILYSHRQEYGLQQGFDKLFPKKSPIILFSDIEPIILSKVWPIILKLFSTPNILCAVLSCVQYKNNVKSLI